ncbi:scaffold protein Nfu/NifU N terminal-domain-containing protein [Kalaharituber pfeilii]|nr:scaffold protein Nfu/NifU N terminal-domain-containing protein [Kalaharituber pfeilii]
MEVFAMTSKKVVVGRLLETAVRSSRGGLQWAVGPTGARMAHTILTSSPSQPSGIRDRGTVFSPILPRPCIPTASTATLLTTTPYRTLFIQTESTPNSDALKFLPGVPILPDSIPANATIEYLSGRTAHSSPLARKLFALDGITGVFYGRDFITVTKTTDASWGHLKPEVFALITEALAQGGARGVYVPEDDAGSDEGGRISKDTAPAEGDTEVVSMIKELLDTRIRPAIQEDGGDIEYRGFDEKLGIVKLKLRGACRTCDSSTVTLRNGIESMLMHYVEEVKGVEQVVDQEEEVALREFEKFEERLRKLNGGEGKMAEAGKE